MTGNLTLRMTLLAALGMNTGLARAEHHAHRHHGPQPVSSGMLLGVYCFPRHGGLEITGTIPGYSARGRLHRRDVLLRVTAEGMPVYRTRTHHEMEFAKSRIGPGREAAIEFWRPGHGKMYAWVTFKPVDVRPQLRSGGPAAPASGREFRAEFRLESEKPGARRMFERRRPAESRERPAPLPSPEPHDAESLFDR